MLDDYAVTVTRLRHRLSAEPHARPTHQPLVSVITICRNAVKTLPACLASVGSQTYPWIEHLIIDGASTDGTIRLLEESTGLAGWISEPDAGISDAFNKGLALCRGTIIGILNADDQYLPEAVSLAVTALTQNPSADFVFGDCDFTLDGRVVLHRKGDPKYVDCIMRKMPVINHPTVFMRRKCYESLGIFRLNIRLAMDYDLLLRFHLAGKIGICIPQTLVRMALGGASCQHILRAHSEAIRISIAHGRPSILAFFTLCRAISIPLARSLATFIGLRSLWLKIRDLKRVHGA